MPRGLDLHGQTFKYLSVEGQSRVRKGNNEIAWDCRCICGQVVTVRGSLLKQGKAQSCGCRKFQIGWQKRNRHEDPNETRSAEYNIWHHMRRRCSNPKDKRWAQYGGRGISVCERWLQSYNNFLADMGRRPSTTHSIDRIDPDGNYEPTNCRWALPIVQVNNRSRKPCPICGVYFINLKTHLDARTSYQIAPKARSAKRVVSCAALGIKVE